MATNLFTNGNEFKILKTRMVANLETNSNKDKYFLPIRFTYYLKTNERDSS